MTGPRKGKLRSLSVAYNAVEDRLRLFVRFEDDVEASLWLTRRFTRLLLEKLEAMAGDLTGQPSSPARDAVKEFQREAALAKADISPGPPPEAPSAQTFPEPFLCTRFDARRAEDDRFHVRFADNGERWMGLVLDARLLHTLTQLLRDTAAKAEWRLAEGSRADTAPHPASVN